MGTAASASSTKPLIAEERVVQLQNQTGIVKQQNADVGNQNDLPGSKVSELERLLRNALEDAAACRAQLNIISQQNLHLQKQLQGVQTTSVSRDQIADVCQQNDRLRMKVSELEALLLAAPSNPSSTHSKVALCSAGIISGQNRRNEQFLRDLFSRHKDASGGLRGQNLAQALRDADAPIIPTTDEEIADFLKQFDANSNATLDFSEFQQAVNEPDELQAWLTDKQLPSAADALRPLIGRCSDQLKALSQLTPADITHAAAATSSIIPQTLQQLHQELQRAFAIQSEIEADMRADPSKFNDSFKMACGSISDFHLGLTGRVGMPHLDFKHAMRQEHCERAGCDVEFTTGNYKITTTPKKEWQYIVDSMPCPDMAHQRRLTPIIQLQQLQVSQDAKLREEEVIAVVLYTGPMFQIYNTILRRYPTDNYRMFADGDNLFSTTIFVLVSAVQKLSRFTRIPLATSLYRGLGGKMDLPDIFFQVDGNGCSGYVEWGFLSTTSDRDVALGYSGVKDRRPKAMVMVIETSSIDRGADISEFSQYPGEREFLYLPCSFVQRVRQGNARVQVVDGGLVAFVSVKVNLNIKTQTVEELQEQKKSLHLVSAKSALAEVKYDLSEWASNLREQGCDASDIRFVVDECVRTCSQIVDEHQGHHVALFSDDEKFRGFINEVLDTKAKVLKSKSLHSKKLLHLATARSVFADVERSLRDWIESSRVQGQDVTEHSRFFTEMMGICAQVVAKHAQCDAISYADDGVFQEMVSLVKRTKQNAEEQKVLMQAANVRGLAATLTGHSDFVWSVAFHPKASIMATGSSDKTVKLWRLSPDNASATCVATLLGHTDSVYTVAFHPTASILLTASLDHTAKLWHLAPDNESASCVATLQGHSSSVLSLALHATAPVLATACYDCTVKLWRLSSDNASASCVATLKGHSKYVTSVAFHPAASIMATGSNDKTVKLWRLSPDNASATCVATLKGHSDCVMSIAFHPTASVLASASNDKTVKLWRLAPDNESATCVATLKGHSVEVIVVAFHPAASIMATGSGDKTVKLWRLSPDSASATCVATLVGHSDSVYSVAFHPTASVLATSSRDKTAKLWR